MHNKEETPGEFLLTQRGNSENKPLAEERLRRKPCTLRTPKGVMTKCYCCVGARMSQNLIFTLEVALLYYNKFGPSNTMLKNTHWKEGISKVGLYRVCSPD